MNPGGGYHGPNSRRHLHILRPSLRRLTAMLLRGQALLRRAEATAEVGGRTFFGRPTGGGGDPQVDWVELGWVGEMGRLD